MQVAVLKSAIREAVSSARKLHGTYDPETAEWTIPDVYRDISFEEDGRGRPSNAPGLVIVGSPRYNTWRKEGKLVMPASERRI